MTVILTDCDGVLLNWEYAFDVWMNDLKYVLVDPIAYKVSKRYNISQERSEELIQFFNESASMGFLPPLRDAVQYVKKLHEECGYIFCVITSMSSNPYAIKLRERNLEKLFGTAIYSVRCLDTGADKDDALLFAKDSGLTWVEDKIKNAELGYELGLNSIIMEHGHNMNYQNNNIPIVKGWKEIYEMMKES